MNESEIGETLRGIARIDAAAALVSAPFVLWAVVRYRRAGRLVRGSPVALPGGSYRGATVRPMVASTVPWVVYAALFAAMMGVVFVFIMAGLELERSGRLFGLSSSEPLLVRAGNVGTALSRFALLAASFAVLRRGRAARGVVTGAVAFTLVATAVWSESVHREMRGWSYDARYLLDAGLYGAGLLLTALLVACGYRAVARPADAEDRDRAAG